MEKGTDFELEGYEFTFITRRNKGGGGVALYVDKSLKFNVVKKMTMVIDNVLECITVEICKEKSKNVIISCIYRAPGSSIETFKDWIEETFIEIAHKKVFICGDFNIDLLNPNKHITTEEFINTMYCMNLFPKITRPTRITSHCATLIDNIFTNDIENKTVSGLLINDISDHLPIFTIYDRNYKINKMDSKKEYRRVRTEERMNAFKKDLLKENWGEVYQEQDVNSAYNEFLRIFTLLYNTNCPIKQYSRKHKYMDCPWITKGLQNACIKKKCSIQRVLKNEN